MGRSDKSKTEISQTKVSVGSSEKKHDVSKENIDKYKYNLFKKVSQKEDRTPNGPFRFELMNDTVLEVTKILEVKTNQLSIEIKTESGNLKKLKIPFSSIKTFLKG